MLDEGRMEEWRNYVRIRCGKHEGVGSGKHGGMGPKEGFGPQDGRGPKEGFGPKEGKGGKRSGAQSAAKSEVK